MIAVVVYAQKSYYETKHLLSKKKKNKNSNAEKKVAYIALSHKFLFVFYL